MKKIILSCAITFAVALLIPQTAQAQGTVYLSNLGQSSAGSLVVGSDSWLAALFRTGTNSGGYVLDSIQLGMTDASGDPIGFTAMLYSINTSSPSPENSLGTLNGSSNPTTDGIYTFTPASNLILYSDAYYYIVLTAGTAVVNGAYEWSYASASSYNPSDGWISGGALQTSSNGSSWSGAVSHGPEYAINATAVPEPGVLSLFALGGLGFLCQRRRQRSGRSHPVKTCPTIRGLRIRELEQPGRNFRGRTERRPAVGVGEIR
jgi:PEP-CTERM motif